MGVGVVAALALRSAAVSAVDTGWSLGNAVEYSDNPALVESAPEDDTARSVVGTISLRNRSSDVNADFEGVFEHNDYASGVLVDHSEATADGTLEWEIVDDTLTWFVRDTFRQIPRETRAVATPDTEQDVNGFVTGPDITARLSAVTYTTLSARYGNFWFEDTDDDHWRQSVVAGLGRQVSPVTDVSLNLGAEQVRFATETATRRDFRRYSAYVGYERRLPHGELGASLGQVHIQRPARDDLRTGLLDLRAVTALTGATRVGINLSAGTTDLGERLLDRADDPLSADPGSVSVTVEVGRERRAALFAEYQDGPLTALAAVDGGVEDYDTDALDRDTVAGTLVITYRLSSLTAVSVTARGLRSEFPALDERDREHAAGIGLRRRLGRSLELAVTAEHRLRRSTLPGSGYEEDRARLELTYFGRRIPERPRAPSTPAAGNRENDG